MDNELKSIEPTPLMKQTIENLKQSCPDVFTDYCFEVTGVLVFAWGYIEHNEGDDCIELGFTLGVPPEIIGKICRAMGSIPYKSDWWALYIRSSGENIDAVEGYIGKEALSEFVVDFISSGGNVNPAPMPIKVLKERVAKRRADGNHEARKEV